MMWGYGGYGGFGSGMGIGMPLFWVLIIVVMAFLVRAYFGSSGTHARAPGLREKTALEILSERYAKDEIDKAEFEQKRSDLRS